MQDGTEIRKTFLHVPSAIEAEEAEEIGVEHLLRDIKDSTTTTLATRVSEQLASLQGLQSRLSDIHTYLLDVAEGKLPVNHQIIYHLQDALNLLPDLSDTMLTQSFTSSRRVLRQGLRRAEIMMQYTLVSSVFIVCSLGRLRSVCYALTPPYLVDRSLVLSLPFRSSFPHCQWGLG